MRSMRFFKVFVIVRENVTRSVCLSLSLYLSGREHPNANSEPIELGMVLNEGEDRKTLLRRGRPLRIWIPIIWNLWEATTRSVCSPSRKLTQSRELEHYIFIASVLYNLSPMWGGSLESIQCERVPKIIDFPFSCLHPLAVLTRGGNDDFHHCT